MYASQQALKQEIQPFFLVISTKATKQGQSARGFFTWGVALGEALTSLLLYVETIHPDTLGQSLKDQGPPHPHPPHPSPVLTLNCLTSSLHPLGFAACLA